MDAGLYERTGRRYRKKPEAGEECWKDVASDYARLNDLAAMVTAALGGSASGNIGLQATSLKDLSEAAERQLII